METIGRLLHGQWVKLDREKSDPYAMTAYIGFAVFCLIASLFICLSIWWV